MTTFTSQAKQYSNYTFYPYHKDLTIPVESGFECIVLDYKTNPKTGKKAKEDSFAIVDSLRLTNEQILELKPFIQSWFDSERKNHLRELHKKDVILNALNVSFDSVLNYLQYKFAPRISTTVVESWFSSDLESELGLKIASNLGLDLNSASDLQKLEKVLQAYKDKFVSLSSNKTILDEKTIAQLEKALNLAIESPTKSQLLSKLDSMKNAEDDILDAL